MLNLTRKLVVAVIGCFLMASSGFAQKRGDRPPKPPNTVVVAPKGEKPPPRDNTNRGGENDKRQGGKKGKG